MDEREVGGACGERDRDRPGRPADEQEEKGDDGGQEELGRSLSRLPQVRVDAAVALRQDPEPNLCEHDRHGDSRRAKDRPAHLVGQDESERHQQARLVEHDAGGIDAGEPARRRPCSRARAGTRSRGADRRGRTRRRRAARASGARRACGSGRGGRRRRRRATSWIAQKAAPRISPAMPTTRRTDRTRGARPRPAATRPATRTDKRHGAYRKREADGEIERRAEREGEREPAADERGRPGKRRRQRLAARGNAPRAVRGARGRRSRRRASARGRTRSRERAAQIPSSAAAHAGATSGSKSRRSLIGPFSARPASLPPARRSRRPAARLRG